MSDNMIHLDNDQTGENHQQPDTTAASAIDDELAGDLHGPGQTSRNGPTTSTSKGRLKVAAASAKRAKKSLYFLVLGLSRSSSAVSCWRGHQRRNPVQGI